MAVRNRRNVESISDNVENLSEDLGSAGRKTMREMSDHALGAFDSFNGPFAKVMDQNRVVFQKMLNAMQEESLRFVNRRLEHTSRALENCRDCHGVAGLMGVQQEFLLDMARDYAEQTRRFADLVRELAEDGAAGITEAASDSLRTGIRHTERNAEHSA